MIFKRPLSFYVVLCFLFGVQTVFAPESDLNSGVTIEEKDFPNTVVKIENCRNIFDIFAPYQKSPAKDNVCGSGFFINFDGQIYIVTNYHVVKNACSLTIKIKAFGAEKLAVKLIGVSPSHDLALLKLTEKAEKRILQKLSQIPVLPIGSSDSLKRGDKLRTLGYPLAVDDLKTTEGVVSGTHVISFPDQSFVKPVIQTDAAINGGNSGGPSINTKGECIGINFASYAGCAEGTAFIIPIDYVKDVLDCLRTTKIYRTPNIGLGCNQIITQCIASWLNLSNDGGIFISSVLEGSIAQKFGIMPGDAIITLNGLKIDASGLVETPWSQDKVQALFVAERFLRQVGLNLEIIRAGKLLEINIPKLEPKDLEQLTAKVGLKCSESESTPCEIFGGCVISELSINHPYHVCQNMGSKIGRAIMQEPAIFYRLLLFLNEENQTETKLIINDVLDGSVAEVSRVGIKPGMIIKSINGVELKDLKDFSVEISKILERQDGFAILESSSGQKFPLNLSDIAEDEVRLAALHGYEKERSTVLAAVLRNS